MKTKKFEHICDFNKKCITLDIIYPPETKFGKIRRKFRESLLISEENGRHCHTPQGTAGYIFQKDQHLTQYFHMIHPYSKFVEYWESFALLEFYLGLIIRTFIVSFLPAAADTLSYQLVMLSADLFETVDVFKQFFIGYMDKEIQEVVLENQKVVSHVLHKFSFYLDILVSLPTECLTYILNFKLGERSAYQFCVFLKIFKIYTMTRYLSHIAKIHNWSDLCVRLVWASFCSFLLCHWHACLFYSVTYKYLIKSEDNIRYAYVYMKSIYAVVCVFFTNEGINSEAFSKGWKNKFFYSCMVIALSVANSVFVGLFIQLLALVRTSKISYDELSQEIQRYLARNNLPKKLHRKVMAYLHFRYAELCFNEEILLTHVSPPLKREISNFFCLKLLKHPNSIFKTLPEDLKSSLCSVMKYEIFLPGDVIFRAGQRAKKIFFLSTGSIAVYSPVGNEILHWFEGHQFGTVSFMPNPVHPVTAIALEMTKCYTLRANDFKKLTADSPDHMEAVKKAAQERIHYTAKLIEDSKEN